MEAKRCPGRGRSGATVSDSTRSRMKRSAWGSVQAIAVDPGTGELLGAVDPRSGGKAAGY